MIDSLVWLSIGAGVFWVASLGFLLLSVSDGLAGSRYYALPPLVSATAGTTYLVMALMTAEIVPQVVSVELVRHVDWLISTPLLVYYLALVAGADARTTALLVVVDAVMILLGVGGTLLGGVYRFVGLGLGVVPFIFLVYLLTNTVNQAARERLGLSDARGLFESLRDLTVGVWSFYPLVWLLGPVLGVLVPSDVNFVFLLLDLTTKVGVMGIVFTRQNAMDTVCRTEGEGALAAD